MSLAPSWMSLAGVNRSGVGLIQELPHMESKLADIRHKTASFSAQSCGPSNDVFGMREPDRGGECRQVMVPLAR